MSEVRAENRELALPPGVYAYTQDTTKGQIKTYTGPIVINQTGQERPVTYDPVSRTFSGCVLEHAALCNILAAEGDYVVLSNPASNGAHPKEASVENAPDLAIGQRVNLPGPCSFSLWPTQSAQVIPGHRLRSNQYLIVRIYNTEKARENWDKTAIRISSDDAPAGAFAVGQLFIIKGTEISFYIPPTGIEVVPDQSGYVREAVTLERLEYSILVDEDGNKRYERGPQVVFPMPTECFVESRGSLKFRALELNEIQGLHIKVITGYTEGGREYREGDELFITGKETAIYFPRPEHSLISYDGKSKHFATAIPAGEGRYILNRMTGEVRLARGPAMLLPDPRTEVIVRRILTESQAAYWYPGNQEALEYNRQARKLLATVPSTRAGAVSEGDFERGMKGTAYSRREAQKGSPMEASMTSAGSLLVAGDEFSRESTYTQPRTVTLDTKFQGVPGIQAWTGYAVMVVSRRGDRRVVQGPDTILLEYDEDLEALHLSTGRPKATDNLYHTVYLRVTSNQISDIVTEVYTKDHIKLTLKLVYRANFEGDPEKWFMVENYVKLLCDHVRSLVKGAIRKLEIRDFYSQGSDILRDIILGKTEDEKRPGLFFPENGLRVSDVEVLNIRIENEEIRDILDQSQYDAVSSNVEIERQERALFLFRRKKEIQRDQDLAEEETLKLHHRFTMEQAERDLAQALIRQANELQINSEHGKVIDSSELNANKVHQAELQRQKELSEAAAKNEKERLDLRIAEIIAETKAVVDRFTVAQGGFSEALLALSHDDTLAKVAQAASIQTALGGSSLVEILSKIFSGTGLEAALTRIAGNGAGVMALKE